jgi:hypothetical protein
MGGCGLGIEGNLRKESGQLKFSPTSRGSGCWRQQAVHVSIFVSVRRQGSKSFNNKVFSAPFAFLDQKPARNLFLLPNLSEKNKIDRQRKQIC